MKKLAIICMLSPSLALADVGSQFGLGLGTQYGGLAGIRFSLGSDTNKVFVGAGLATHIGDEKFGMTLGWEKAVANKHALGLLVRTRTINDGCRTTDDNTAPQTCTYDSGGYESFIGGTYTYYFDKPSESGFLAGFSAGKSYRHTDLLDEFRPGMEYGLHIGYQF